ncbi:glutamate receptor ionotropic, kainate 2-like isoform X2 [Paramacrobiotus metropolitanus]|nr:glutamate receptor ionotropic, kainate 2-like isoform X2 [Paramacrobiotus metropolitanus]
MLSAHVQSICATLEIPHVAARWELEPPFRQATINLYPSYSVLNQAFADIIDHWKWKSMVILYEDQFGLVKLQSLLKLQSDSKNEVYIQQVHNGDYRGALLSIKEMNIFNIVVDIADEQLHHVLRAMLQLQMNDFRYHYFFTTFNLELLNLEDFRHNYVNITGFRLIKRDETPYKEIAQSLHKLHESSVAIGIDSYYPFNESLSLTADAALMYDAVLVFAESLASLSESVDITFTNLSCDDPKDVPWVDGEIVQNYLNSASVGGLTGQIRFSKGQRDDFELDIIRLAMERSPEAFLHIGTWNPTNKTKLSDVWFASYDPTKNRSKSVNLIVATKVEKPYVMQKNDTETLIGNDRYEGFCIELMQKIAEKAGFNYTLVLVHDNQYGVAAEVPGSNGKREWTGLIGELVNKKADLAMAALSITYEREKAIDFTKPFMNLGISIIFRIPKTPPSLFSFMKPLSTEIWMYVLCAYAVVSLELFVIARFSPYEWYNPHPCNVHHDIVENQFTLSNTLWFCIGTLMQQGSDVYPRAFSTRIVGGIWWFFTLIIISSYTANLAAFLTVERMVSPIDGADDLAKNKDGIKYGVVTGGSTYSFFKDAKIPVYQTMFKWMQENPHVSTVQDYEEGLARVLQGNYAFLMESTMIEYATARDCNLTQIGGLLDSKGYGIGTPKESIWRDKLSLIILELQENGIISELKERWWNDKTVDCKKNDRKKESLANALNVDNFGGAFVVLAIGLVGGVMVSVFEFMWNSRKNAHIDKQSLCSEMVEELRFAVRCRGSRQKPTLRRQCSQCIPNHTTYVPNNLEFLGPEAHNGGLGMSEYRKHKRPYFDAHSVDHV